METISLNNYRGGAALTGTKRRAIIISVPVVISGILTLLNFLHQMIAGYVNAGYCSEY
jgi:hypothetical protein